MRSVHLRSVIVEQAMIAQEMPFLKPHLRINEKKGIWRSVIDRSCRNKYMLSASEDAWSMPPKSQRLHVRNAKRLPLVLSVAALYWRDVYGSTTTV